MRRTGGGWGSGLSLLSEHLIRRQASTPHLEAKAAKPKGQTKPLADRLVGVRAPSAATPIAKPACLAITVTADAMPLASGGASAITAPESWGWDKAAPVPISVMPAKANARAGTTDSVSAAVARAHPPIATSVSADAKSRRQPNACELPFPSESVFPVVAPRLLRTVHPGQDWQALPLLAKGRRGEETRREWSWATWLRKGPGREALRFRDIGSSLQAAMDGNGVALGRSLLVADALRQQRLVRLAGPDEAQACSKTQVARWRDPQDHTAERMGAWLVSSAARDVADGKSLSADAA